MTKKSSKVKAAEYEEPEVGGATATDADPTGPVTEPGELVEGAEPEADGADGQGIVDRQDPTAHAADEDKAITADDAPSTEGFELGKPAPSDLYKEAGTGKVSTKRFARSRVLIREGSTVTEPILVELGVIKPSEGGLSGFVRV